MAIAAETTTNEDVTSVSEEEDGAYGEMMARAARAPRFDSQTPVFLQNP